MAQKLSISSEEILQIVKMYLQDKMTVKQIIKKIPYSETFITETLKKQNVYINTKYICKEGFKKSDLKKEIFRIKDELLINGINIIRENNDNDKKNFIAICKKTGKEFNDYKNSSGNLTEHLKIIYPDLIHPTNFLKQE